MAELQAENAKLDATLDYIAELDAENIQEACEGARRAFAVLAVRPRPSPRACLILNRTTVQRRIRDR